MSQLAREVILGQTSECTDPHDFTRRSIPRGSFAIGQRSESSDQLDIEATAHFLHGAERDHQAEGAQPQIVEAQSFSKCVRWGINASWAVNIVLLIAKITSFVLSGSYAVLASAVDSLVDILSQAVLAVAEYQAARYDRRFPIGRTRMAELSVLACATIMFVSTSLVIREAAGSLWEGFHGRLPHLTVDAVLFSVLGAATASKVALYLYCRTLRKNPIMVALSEDHLNDVMSNVAALGGVAVAAYLPNYWWVDPGVALVVALLITKNWVAICWEQGQKMIGLEAPDELIQEATQVTANHHPSMQLDRLTAYHHGSHMVVEVEVLLPPAMSVKESHDIALALQHKIEAIDSVERAFVHVDYERRPLEEHKVERNLKLGVRDVMQPLPGYDVGSPPSPPRAAAGAAAVA